MDTEVEQATSFLTDVRQRNVVCTAFNVSCTIHYDAQIVVEVR